MKCVIPGANMKVFGRAIHSLSKIGDELYVEALEKGLSVRTVNSSRSAYACFLFSPAFFSAYSCRNNGGDKGNDTLAAGAHNDDDGGGNQPRDAADAEVLKCKIGMKSCLGVFKSLPMLDKLVEKCKITLKLDEDRLVFQLFCKHGIVKTHNLSFIECETLEAVFTKEFCPNVLSAQTKLLTDVVGHFHAGQEEVSLSVSPQSVIVKSYVDGGAEDRMKAIRTQFTLTPEEFESYRVGVDAEVTFCLKELKALLLFSEPSNLPVSLRFESAGRPMILSVDTDKSFEANFVLATMADTSRTQATNTQQQSQHPPPPPQRQFVGKTIRQKTVPANNARDKVAPASKNKRTTSNNNQTDDNPAWPENDASRRATVHPSAVGGGQGGGETVRQKLNKRTAPLKDKEQRSLPERVESSCMSTSQDCEADDTTVDIVDMSTIAIVSRSISDHLRPAASERYHHHGVTATAERSTAARGDGEGTSGSIGPVCAAGAQGAVAGHRLFVDESNSGSPTLSVVGGLRSSAQGVAKMIVTQNVPAQPVVRVTNPLLVLAEDSSDSQGGDEGEEELVAGTPPHKKFCLSFIGVSQPTTTTPSIRPPPALILAQDSEED